MWKVILKTFPDNSGWIFRSTLPTARWVSLLIPSMTISGVVLSLQSAHCGLEARKLPHQYQSKTSCRYLHNARHKTVLYSSRNLPLNIQACPRAHLVWRSIGPWTRLSHYRSLALHITKPLALWTCGRRWRKGWRAQIRNVTLWPFELMRNLFLQLSELSLLVFITLLPLQCVPLVPLRIRLRRAARTEPGDMPRPLTLVTTHVLTTSLTTILSWPLPPL